MIFKVSLEEKLQKVGSAVGETWEIEMGLRWGLRGGVEGLGSTTGLQTRGLQQAADFQNDSLLASAARDSQTWYEYLNQPQGSLPRKLEKTPLPPFTHSILLSSVIQSSFRRLACKLDSDRDCFPWLRKMKFLLTSQWMPKLFLDQSPSEND